MASEIPDILRSIVEQRRSRLADSRSPLRVASGDGASFLEALRIRRSRAVIAEIKLGSPRIGSLVDKIDPERQAATYSEAGAAALSVVVEPDFFFGSYELLSRAKGACGLPVVAKDFVVDEVQLDWAHDAGADAVLLIAALHSPERLGALAVGARERGLVPLVELHDRTDLERLGDETWELVGVNNRDLRTFEVSLASSEALVPELPSGALRVAESGIGSGEDLRRLAAAGFDAFLVGEALLLSDDPGGTLRELVS